MKSPEEDGGGKRGRGELAAGHGGSEGVAAGPLGCNLRLGGSQVELSCSRLTEKQQTSHVGLDDGLFMVYVSAEASAQTPISCLAAVLLLCLRPEVTLSARTLRDVRPMI